MVVALPSLAQQPPASALVDPFSPAVVLIQTKVPGIGTKSGSGFFIEPDGFILTARRLIEGASAVSVRTDEGTRLTAAVVNYSTDVDAAILKVDAIGVPVLHLADSDAVRPGQEVLGLGYPLQEDRSVALSRVVSEPSDGRRIQVDTSFPSGFVGGPAVTTTGEVIGIVERTLTSVLAANALRDLATHLSSRAIRVPPVPQSEYPVSGRWDFTLSRDSGGYLSSSLVTCRQNGEAVTCTEDGDGQWDGRFNGDTQKFELHFIEATFYRPFSTDVAEFTGKLVAPDRLEGEWTYRRTGWFITWFVRHGHWVATKI